MKQLHVAIVNLPHFPHLMPTIPIVSVLIRRGYRVTYVTSRRFAPAISDVGGEVILCPEYNVQKLIETRAFELKFEEGPLLELALSTLKVIEGFFEKNPPGLIIYDILAFAGRILADRSTVPAIQTSPTFLHDLHTLSDAQIDPKFRDLVIASEKEVDAGLESLGVPSGDYFAHRSRLNIFLFPSAFQPNRHLFGDGYFFAGRCPAETAYKGVGQITHLRERSTVLVSTSTTFTWGPEYFRLCMAALANLDLRVVMLVRDPILIRALGELPSNVEILQDVSHAEVLPHCNLMICHGGIITPAEAAYHGVPMVMTSHGVLEFEFQADVLANIGMGLHLRESDMTKESIRRAALYLLEDPVAAEKIRRLQHSIRREPGAEETVNRIEDYLEQGV